MSTAVYYDKIYHRVTESIYVEAPCEEVRTYRNKDGRIKLVLGIKMIFITFIHYKISLWIF